MALSSEQRERIEALDAETARFAAGDGDMDALRAAISRAIDLPSTCDGIPVDYRIVQEDGSVRIIRPGDADRRI